MKISRNTIAALTVLAVAGSASAGSITSYYQATGLGFGSYSWDRVDGVNTLNESNSYLGPLSGTRQDVAGPGVDSLIGKNYDTFCVDIPRHIYINSTSTHTDVLPLLGSSNGPVTFDADKTGKISSLWATWMPTLANSTDGAALQLAMWKVTYDSGLDLSTGNFTAVNTSGIGLRAQEMLNGMDPSKHANMLLLKDDNTQNLITAAPVPEPASVGVLAVGILGMIRRRKMARG